MKNFNTCQLDIVDCLGGCIISGNPIHKVIKQLNLEDESMTQEKCHQQIKD